MVKFVLTQQWTFRQGKFIFYFLGFHEHPNHEQYIIKECDIGREILKILILTKIHSRKFI